MAFWLSSGKVYDPRTQPIFYMDSILYQSFQNADISAELIEYNHWRAEVISKNPTYAFNINASTLSQVAYKQPYQETSWLGTEIYTFTKQSYVTDEFILIFGDSTLFSNRTDDSTSTSNTTQIPHQILRPNEYSAYLTSYFAPHLFKSDNGQWELGFIRGSGAISSDVRYYRGNNVNLFWLSKT